MLDELLKEVEELKAYKKAFEEQSTIVVPHSSYRTGIYTMSDNEVIKELKARLDAANKLAEIYKNKLIRVEGFNLDKFKNK